jgi:hypothetical protein
MFKEQTEEEIDEVLKEALIEKSEMSLLIKNYNDIFSSFDPRPFSEKSLSDDFLQEAKRAARDKKGVYELRFLVPKLHRNSEHEAMIKKRLKEHFRKHHHLLEDDVVEAKKSGWIKAFVGIAMIFGASYLSSLISSNIGVHFVTLILEAGGWFTAWTGLEEAFYIIKEKKPDLDFYNKMAEADIKFSSY